MGKAGLVWDAAAREQMVTDLAGAFYAAAGRIGRQHVRTGRIVMKLFSGENPGEANRTDPGFGSR